MNIELKPIAESKVRQLGGDVCGVLVRKGDKVATVTDMGRVKWLSNSVLWPIANECTSEREAFEDAMAGEAHLKWIPEVGEYSSQITHKMWQTWRCARAGEDPDLQLIEQRDHWEEKATELAEAVGEHFGFQVGEHSSANCPVQNAIDQLDELGGVRAQGVQGAEPVEFQDYDAGMLNDWGGGNVSWWLDYLRAEIERANNHWREQTGPLPLYTRPQPAQQWTASGVSYDHSIHTNPDAKAWADLFMQTFPDCGADPETMHGWFANAMMAMYDHLKNTQPQPAVPEGWRECLAEMVQAMHDYEMSVEEGAPYKHRAMMDRAHALLSATSQSEEGEGNE